MAKRPNRATSNGYWKALAADNGVGVGSRKTLVYYEGKLPNCKKKKTSTYVRIYSEKSVTGATIECR